MLIESIIRRPEGTVVTFDDGESFSFQPVADDGPHVAEVKSPDKIERFLAITEGFRPFDEGVPASKPHPLDHDGDGRPGGSLPKKDRPAQVEADAPEEVSPKAESARATTRRKR
jgi:hypothetical protein